MVFELELFTNGSDFVVATSEQEARRYLREADPELTAAEIEGAGWQIIPRTRVLRWTWKCRQQPHLPTRVVRIIEKNGAGVAVHKPR